MLTNLSITNNEYLFADGNSLQDVSRLKDRFSVSLRNIFHTLLGDNVNANRRVDQDGTLGTHSLRKFSATWARTNGCSPDDVDIRGRWKRNARRVVDR
jgi:hypothetical protein